MRFRSVLDGPDFDLRVIVGDARETLPVWEGRADAWFLDGFSPAKNPELWSPELMTQVAAHTLPGGTAATYTAAGFVRRGLAEAGFDVTRVPGYGRKRHMTRAVLRMTQSNNIPLGIVLMIATTFVFAVQDGLSRHLAGEYNVLMIVMIRYWFFAAFVIAIAKRRAGGIRAAARTDQPFVQITRGLLLSLEICVMVAAFTILGLVESHAVFTCYPLLVAALSGPVLGEHVGWRRWAAIGVGFVGRDHHPAAGARGLRRARARSRCWRRRCSRSTGC